MKAMLNLFSLLGLALVATLAVPAASAQMVRGQGHRMPKYDPSIEVTVKGTVEAVEEGMMRPGNMQPMGNMGTMGQMGQMGSMQHGQMNSNGQMGQMGNMGQMGQMGQMGHRGHMGLHLTLKTDSESYTVLVGPAQFVKDKGFTFAKGDQIEVTGSKVKFGDGDALIAREIKKGDKILTLRNAQGIPDWSRRPRN
jgi:hypothetical protein